MSTENTSELDPIRKRLDAARGKEFWRSLDELADTPAFRTLVEREFPQGASEMIDPVTRRTFLKIMGASLALAGVTGCTYQTRQYIAPFDRAPEGRVPGIPLYYASTVNLGGYGAGVLVKSNDGRPTKIEGNPRHPASLGATDIFTQASILQMYDPDRSQQVLERGAPTSYNNFLSVLGSALTGQSASGGASLRLLTQTITSPTLAAQIGRLLERYPNARWYQYEPINRDNVREGARVAFGDDVDTRYDLSKAQVIVALDADFLAPGPGFLTYARAFSTVRKVTKETQETNRLYVIESSPSTTGTAAEHRLAMQARKIESYARLIAQNLGLGNGPAAEVSFSETEQNWARLIAEDLEAHRGTSVVLVGDQQPAALHALAHALNAELGNVGETVLYTDPVAARPTNQVADLAELMRELGAGTVDTLVILGGNPAYDAPGDLPFAQALANARLSVHLSLYNDETSRASTWHIPAAHALEGWGDLRAFDGTASLVQPLIEPLYDGKTDLEILAAMLGEADRTPYEIVRSFWAEQNSGDGAFDAIWQVALAQGVLPGEPAATRSVTLNEAAAIGEATAPDLNGLELIFRPDPSVWDGSFANNGWLQELPRPLTKLTWDNAALMSPRTAYSVLGLGDYGSGLDDQALERLQQANNQVIQIRYRGGVMELPVWLQPGHPEDSITVTLGYGRSAAGRVGDGVGVNVYPVRTSDALWFGSGAQVSTTGRSYPLVSTQDHWSMERRDIYRVGVLERFKEDPKYIKTELYEKKYGREEPDYESFNSGNFVYGPKSGNTNSTTGNKWGMTIDLNSCIGCNACIIACQSENNIPVVGKEQVGVGREMHWIRLDRYYSGDVDNPTTYVIPVTCMQCEQAPCELVCPVAATVHDGEGINNMVYNRCVGTKYCSNNCPYKVRRFNFLQYTDRETIQLQLMRNPDVTVRNRGVMEKCTYCVQRISDARIAAKREAVQTGQTTYTIPDGAIVTACEAACPTEAIVFGDLGDANSRVSKWHEQPHNYYLLGELNTKPRTTYIARVRNPNEALG
jgi:MoCo/4Fe-4S cofactor protein with predicted Tat translocation signal